MTAVPFLTKSDRLVPKAASTWAAVPAKLTYRALAGIVPMVKPCLVSHEVTALTWSVVGAKAVRHCAGVQ